MNRNDWLSQIGNKLINRHFVEVKKLNLKFSFKKLPNNYRGIFCVYTNNDCAIHISKNLKYHNKIVVEGILAHELSHALLYVKTCEFLVFIKHKIFKYSRFFMIQEEIRVDRLAIRRGCGSQLLAAKKCSTFTA